MILANSNILPELQAKFNARLEQESLEQKELRGLVENLERQVREKDAAQNDRESYLRIQEDKLSSERRKFETERDICFAKLELEKSRIQVFKKNLLWISIDAKNTNAKMMFVSGNENNFESREKAIVQGS